MNRFIENAPTKMLLLAALLMLASKAHAQGLVPQQLSYQGKLTSLSGVSSTGAHSIVFAIWPSVNTGFGQPLWSDTLEVTVVNGLYQATLGTTPGDPLPPSLFDGTVRYLALTVDGDALSPLQPIGSVPYSILAGGVQGGNVNTGSVAINGTTVVTDAGRVVLNAGGNRRSLFGVFCGASRATTGAITDSNATGYRATKTLCEATCSSPTAHMCSSSEAIATMELGVTYPSTAAWVSAGTYTPENYQYSNGFIESNQADDCSGWTNNGALNGPEFAGNAPTWGACSVAIPIACCD